MLKWLNHLKINAKLFVMLVVPLGSLLYFSVTGVVEKFAVVENMRQVETLAGISTRIGAAAHEIQKERGLTALFLASQGTRSAAELAQQRAATDEKIGELQSALQEIEVGQYSAALQAVVDEALGLIERLPEKRAQVDDLQVSGADSFAYYTSTITSLLTATSQTAPLSRESETARQASTYQMLLEAKERAGRERALLSNALSAGQFDADQFSQFLSNSTEQDTYLGLFLNSATDEQRAFHRSSMTGADVDEVARIKEAALEAGPQVSLGFDADAWFDAATARINLLKETEDRLAADLSATAGRVRQDALRAFWTFAALSAVSVMLALAGGFLVSRAIAGPLQTMERASTAIAAGDLQQTIVVESRDELGALAGAFNQMAARLRDLIGSLEQRVADRTKALATSTEVSRRLSTILEQKQLVTEVVEQVQSAFNYYHAHIYLMNESGEELILASGTGEAGQTMLARGHKIPKGRGLVGRAAETNAPVLVSDTSKDPDWLPNPLLPETKSEAAIPISIGNQALGVLDVQHNITDGLQQEDVDLLQSIANQVAVAMQNTRQYENTRKIAADMGVVANVGIATSTITDAGRLLQEVVNLSKKSFNLYHTHIYLLNEAGDLLDLASGAGEVGKQMVSEKHAIPLDSEKSLVARAARTREGVVVNDVTLAPDFLPNPLLPDTRSEMAVPMVVAGKVIGVLDAQSETANRFTDVDVSIQTTLASQIAVALQNARSFSQSQRQAERETSVNLITQKIQNATSIEAALRVAARELGHALGMKSTLVTLEPEALAGEPKDN